MANHCEVWTKKPMSASELNNLFDHIVKNKFNSQVQYNYDFGTEDFRWGDHVWMWQYVMNKELRDVRVCWFFGDGYKDPYHFEIRHGGGNRLDWWIDYTITNEVAKHFDGVVIDDGDGIIQKPTDGKTFIDYLCSNLEKDDFEKYIPYLMDQMEYYPSSFRLTSEDFFNYFGIS